MPRSWRKVKDQIESAIDSIWMQEPAEIRRVSWGVTRTGAGTGDQYFTNLVSLETYTLLLGQRTLYSLMLTAVKPSISLDHLRELTRAFTCESFNPFEFLSDLGLESINQLGTAYLGVLDDLQSKEDYVELTGALFTYVSRMHRWVHLAFPWNIGLAFPQRRSEEIKAMADLLLRDGP